MAFDTFDIWQRRGVKAIFRAVLLFEGNDVAGLYVPRMFRWGIHEVL